MANALDMTSNPEAGTQTDLAQSIDVGTQTDFTCPHCTQNDNASRLAGDNAAKPIDNPKENVPQLQAHVPNAVEVGRAQDSVHVGQPAVESPAVLPAANNTAQSQEPRRYNLRHRPGKARDSQATSQTPGKGAKRPAPTPDTQDDQEQSETQNETSSSGQSNAGVRAVRRRQPKTRSQPKSRGSQFIQSAQQLSDESEPSSSDSVFIDDSVESDEAPARERRTKSAALNNNDSPLHVLSDNSAGVGAEKPKRRRLTKHGGVVKDGGAACVGEGEAKPARVNRTSKVQSTMAERIRANKQRVLSQALDPEETQGLSSDEEEPGRAALNSAPEDSCSGDSLDDFIEKEGSHAEYGDNVGSEPSKASEDEGTAGVDDRYRVYLKYHLLSLLDGHFRMSRHTDAAPLHEGVRHVENQLSIHRESLVASSAWKEDFRRALDSRPMYFSREVGDLTDAGTCEACGRSNHPARMEISLSGAACDVSTFWANFFATTSQSAAPSKTPDKFYVGINCHARTHLWHELQFYPWRLRLALQHYLQKHATTSDKRTPCKYAQLVLADQVYVSCLYDNYKALLQRGMCYMEDIGRRGRGLPTSVAGEDLFTLTHAIDGSEGRVISGRDWQRWLSRHVLQDNKRPKQREIDSSTGDEVDEGEEEEGDEEGDEPDEDEVKEIAGHAGVPSPDNKRSAQQMTEEVEFVMARRGVASPWPQRRMSAAHSIVEDEDVSPSAGRHLGGPRKLILDDDDDE